MGQSFTPSSPNPNGNSGRNYGNTRRATPHDITKMNVFLPDPDVWPEPPNGYPVVLWLNLQAYKTTVLNEVIGDAQVPQQALLEGGVALAVVSLPVVRDPNTTGWATSDGSTVNLSTNTFGPAYRGNGVHVHFDGGPSTSTPYPGAMPAGYGAAFPGRPHPMIDPDWLCAWTSGEDAIRHLRHHSVDLGDGAIRIDSTKIGAYGNSAGAHVALWLCHGDKALVAENISYGGQEARSTRPNMLMIQNPAMSLIAYETDSDGPEVWSIAKAGSGSSWDESCSYIEDAAGSPPVRSLLSPLYFLNFTDFSPTEAWTGMKAANAIMPVWASANVGPSPASVLAAPKYGPANAFGFSGTNSAGIQDAHDIYSLYLLPRFFDLTRLISLDESFIDADAVSAHGAIKQIDASIETTDALFADLVSFALAYIGPTAIDDTVADDAGFYCTVAEAAAIIPNWPETSWPAAVNAVLELQGIDAQINMALASIGISSIPWTTTETSGQKFIFANWLKDLCRTGTAYRIVRILFPDVDQAGESPLWGELKAKYDEGIAQIKAGEVPDFLLDSASDIEPTTVNTRYGGTDVTASILKHKGLDRPAFTRARSDTF